MPSFFVKDEDKEAFARGAFAMASYLVRAGASNGYCLVFNLDKEHKYNSTLNLLRHFSGSYGLQDIDSSNEDRFSISELAAEIERLSLDYTNNYFLSR